MSDARHDTSAQPPRDRAPTTPPATPAARRLPPEGTFTDTAPFWRGTREGKLVLQYCTETGRLQHYPRPVSLATGRRTLAWKEVSGQGRIYARTILRTPGLGADARLPCPLALVELDEGVRILANLLGEGAERLAIGDRVRLTWDELGGDARYPAFTAT